MPSSNRICFDAVAASRAKKLNCCGFETCGDCATLWFEHERACPGCRAEASLQKNVEDYSRGVRTGAAGDEVRAVDGDDDDKSASGNGDESVRRRRSRRVALVSSPGADASATDRRN
jgi:hypothetical protein